DNTETKDEILTNVNIQVHLIARSPKRDSYHR
ncbi:unnamed protein product, partial [marine sediment metagenome]